MPLLARTRSLLAVGTALVALAAAGPASADSISYVKNGDIWLSTPDGARQYQVTHSGIYSEASQADDGTFIAVTGERLQHIGRTGAVLADFATPVSDGPPHTDGSDYFNGPYDAQISPDGTRVAYTYYWQHYSWDPTCNCFHTRLESGLALSYADRLTSWDEFGGPLTGWKWGAWVDDDTILRSDAGVILNEDVVLNDVGPGLGDDQLTRWFTDNAVNSLDQAEMNRQQTLLAAAVDDPRDSWQIRVYRTTGAPPLLPQACFAYNTDDASHQPDAPAFSPDGYGLAFELDGGIAVGRIPAMPTGCVLPSQNASIIVQDASSPDWGPADVPVAPPAPAPVPTPAPAPPAPAPSTPAGPAAPTGPATPAQPGAPAATLQVSAAAPKLRVALSSGLKLSLKLPAGGTVTASGKVGSKVVARGTLANARAGARSLTLRFSAAGKAALRGARSVKLRVVVVVKPSGAAAQTRTLTVTLRR